MSHAARTIVNDFPVSRSVSHSVSQSVIQSDYVLYAKYHVPQLLQSVFVDKILESAGSLAALFNVLLSARALRT